MRQARYTAALAAVVTLLVPASALASSHPPIPLTKPTAAASSYVKGSVKAKASASSTYLHVYDAEAECAGWVPLEWSANFAYTRFYTSYGPEMGASLRYSVSAVWGTRIIRYSDKWVYVEMLGRSNRIAMPGENWIPAWNLIVGCSIKGSDASMSVAGIGVGTPTYSTI